MHFCRLHPLLPAFATKGKWGSPGEQLADSWGQSFYWSAWDRNTIWPRAMPHSHLLLLDYRLLGVVSVRRTSQKINGVICFSSHLCFKSFRTWQAMTETDHVFITSCYGMYYPALWCQVTLGVCVQGSRRHSRDVTEVRREAVRLPPETWLGSWNQHGVEGKVLEISFQPYYRRLCERGGTWSSKCMTFMCMCCFGSMLDAGSRQTELPGVMATSRGRPSVWYSAALWELNAVTSLGTPCTLNQGLHHVKGSFCLLYQQWTRFLQPAVPYERVTFFLSYTFSKI